MKKTIVSAAIALFSASFCMAETTPLTLDDAVKTVTSGIASAGTVTSDTGTYFTSGDNGTAHAFTMTVVFDWADIIAEVEDKTTSGNRKIVELFSDSTSNTKVGIGLSRWGEGYYAHVTSGTNVSDATHNLGSSTDPSDFIIDGKLVLTLTQTSDKIVLHALKNTDDVYTLTTAATGYGSFKVNDDLFDTMWFGSNCGTIDTVYVFNNTMDDSNILSVSKAALTAAIPEPATATLSLLALAGLAARRRRK